MKHKEGRAVMGITLSLLPFRQRRQSLANFQVLKNRSLATHLPTDRDTESVGGGQQCRLLTSNSLKSPNFCANLVCLRTQSDSSMDCIQSLLLLALGAWRVGRNPGGLPGRGRPLSPDAGAFSQTTAISPHVQSHGS